jgi:hypothetical protein
LFLANCNFSTSAQGAAQNREIRRSFARSTHSSMSFNSLVLILYSLISITKNFGWYFYFSCVLADLFMIPLHDFFFRSRNTDGSQYFEGDANCRLDFE